MDEMYGPYTTSDYSEKAAATAALMISPENLILPSTDNYYNNDHYQMSNNTNFLYSEPFESRFNPVFVSNELLSATGSISRTDDHDRDISSTLIKAKIASHPSYPRLLQAYIDCQKVGAPPEIVGLLDELRRENDIYRVDDVSTSFGADPELDEFMETYCDLLQKYKCDLQRPFDEANNFLNKIELQLRNLSCAEEGGESSEEEVSGGEVQETAQPTSSEERDIKEKLIRRFGSHISSLKLEFSKKKKKGKLPKEARQTLLDWWSVHYKWPYPTEADKIALAESTGLDQKQINNWFINQRKRHWKPSENMHFAVMDPHHHNISGQFYTDD